MSGKADLKHSVALFAVAIGGLGLIVAAGTAYVAIDSGKPGWWGCAAVSGLVSLFQIRRGLKLRDAAVAEGATLFEEDPLPGTGHTTRTEARKPSFLRDKEKVEDEDADEETFD